MSSTVALAALVVALAIPTLSVAQTVDPAGSGSVTPGQGIGDAVQQSCGFGKKAAKAKARGAKKKRSCSRRPKHN